MILTNSGVLKLMQRIKSFITAQLNTKAPSVHTHTLSEIDDLSSLSMGGGGYSKSEVDTLLNSKSDISHTHTKSQITDFPSYGTTANTICEGNDSRLSDARTPTAHTHSASDITSGLATVATSGSYNDLSNKPTIPTVNNATLTIQKNGTTVDSFTANSSTDKTVNITVPTKTSDLNNDSGFITSDNTKIPLAGTNALSGSIVPDTDNAYDLGSSSHNLKRVYTGRVINGLNDDALILIGGSGGGANIELYGKNHSPYGGWVSIKAVDNNGQCQMILKPDGTLKWGSKNVAMQEDTVPRSAGAVMTGRNLSRNVDNSSFGISGGTGFGSGGTVGVWGKNSSNRPGCVQFNCDNGSNSKEMVLYPNGTWTWTGTACQITSDKRFKQQITEIDNKLLDAWEDVNLVQFKYNDAVKEKSDNARLHTGYVVQQIDEACKSHNVDISEYGLYCHEEYPERTEEVEVQQDDGSIKKETKVIEEASEHYSLRYTETLVVECAYLRRENTRLKERLSKIEKLLNI